VRPLTDALQGGPRPQSQIQWSVDRLAAFEAAKAAILAATQLAHPSPAAELTLVTDASGSHAGAVLQQRVSRQPWRPLGFFSQKLSPAESRYSAFDRELLAVYLSILHFRHLLEGRHFHVFSDHKPLAGALNRVADPRSDRQRWQLSFISEFVSEIQHIAGSSNVVADTLSRPPAATLQLAPSPTSPSPPSLSPPSPSHSADTGSPGVSSGGYGGCGGAAAGRFDGPGRRAEHLTFFIKTTFLKLIFKIPLKIS
jgi:hypothetical protein